MTTDSGIPVLPAYERPQPRALLSPALSQHLGAVILALAVLTLLVGLVSLLGAPGVHWPALWLVLPGAGLVGVARWVLGESWGEWVHS